MKLSWRFVFIEGQIALLFVQVATLSRNKMAAGSSETSEIYTLFQHLERSDKILYFNENLEVRPDIGV
jgi:hypothetical protein